MEENRDADEGIDADVLRALEGLPSDFSGFERHYQDVIRPGLQAREHDRQLAADKAVKGRWGGAGLGLTGLALGLFVAKVPFIAILGAMAGFGAYLFMGRDLARIGREAKTLMVLPIAERLGLSYMEDCGPQELVHEMRAAKLLPNWHRSAFEDRLSGVRHGVDFEFFEAHLEQKRRRTNSRGQTRTEWVTVFRGQCLRFDFHKAFYGRTLILRDAGWFNGLGGERGMKRAKLEDPVFEKAFEVYTTDQVESRYLLTPDVMQDIVDLEAAFHGSKIRCAFLDGQVLIAVEGADLFEPGSLFTPLDNPERIRDLLEDFAAVFHLIDALSSKKKLPR